MSVCHLLQQVLLCHPCSDTAVPWCRARLSCPVAVLQRCSGCSSAAAAGQPQCRGAATPVLSPGTPSPAALPWPVPYPWPPVHVSRSALGTVKGQSLNEPLRDLPQLLRVSLPSAGREAQPVLFHSITFSKAFSTCLPHTNKLIINEDTNWGLFP